MDHHTLPLVHGLDDPASSVIVPHVTTCSYPLRGGNAVTLLVDAENSFRRIAEAVEAARHRIWVTVAFVAPWFRFPDQHGSFLDLLQRAADRGLDVRVIAWRPDPAIWSESDVPGWENVLGWADDALAALASQSANLSIRWDTLPGLACHPQKTWLIDAGDDGAVAFVGGINLTARTLHQVGHAGGDQSHDLYAEVAGPVTDDVHHNFVQRWNEASERDRPEGRWGPRSHQQLAFPGSIPAIQGSSTAQIQIQGSSTAQIQRTVPASTYFDRSAAPESESHPIEAGERTILQQYQRAIDAAQRTIHIQNQVIPVIDILNRLRAAVHRGVLVSLVVPAVPQGGVLADPQHPKRWEIIALLTALDDFPHFSLLSLAGLGPDARHQPVYVHAKAMLVDDAWATIGSGNLHEASLTRNTELNISIWDPIVVREWRARLFDELIDRDTSHVGANTANSLLRQVGHENRIAGHVASGSWSGIAFEMDAHAYGLGLPAALPEGTA